MAMKIVRASRSGPSADEVLLDALGHNEMFDVLGNRRRRYVLCYLLGRDGPTECRELAEQIAAWEADSEREQVKTSEYQSVYNSLYQTHLPELESADLVEYDRSENLIFSTDRTGEVERFVVSATPRFSHRLTYRLLKVVGGVLLLGSVAGTQVFGSRNTSLSVTEVVLVSFASILGRGYTV